MSIATIRIWLDTGYNKAHVSLQIEHDAADSKLAHQDPEGIYVSIYPTGRGVALLNREGRTFKLKTLQQDEKKYEGKEPPVVIKLYSLDCEKIEREYKKLAESGFNFSMLGSSMFKDAKTHNCCSIVLYLLKEGGMYNIFDKFSRIKDGAKWGALSGAVTGGLSGAFAGGVWSYLETLKEPVFGSALGLFLIILGGASVGLPAGFGASAIISSNAAANGAAGVVAGGIAGGITGAIKDFFWLPDKIITNPKALISVLECAAVCEVRYFYQKDAYKHAFPTEEAEEGWVLADEFKPVLTEDKLEGAPLLKDEPWLVFTPK